MLKSRRVAIVTLFVALAVAPYSAASAAQGTWRSERSQRGDTTIVRTIGGSVWRDTLRLVPELAIGKEDGAAAFLFGEIIALDVDASGRIFVLDRQGSEIRVFSPTGEHLRTFGRRGGGPGEFNNPHFMRVTRDGRVIVRDQTRFSIISAEGAYLGGWMFHGGFGTNAPFYLTNDGRVLNPTFSDRLVWYSLDGKSLDTIPVPRRGAPAPQLDVVQSGGGRASYSIAYMPRAVWTFAADGLPLIGRNDTYTFDVSVPGQKVLRIERAVQPAPVPRAEAEYHRAATTRSIQRGNNPAWRWNGPDIPATKPAYSGFFTGTDGTIWVSRYTASREEKNSSWDPQRPTVGTPTYWTSTPVLDLFDAQGRYLGAVTPPTGASLYPQGVFSAERVYLVSMHEDGYPQVVRYRVVR